MHDHGVIPLGHGAARGDAYDALDTLVAEPGNLQSLNRSAYVAGKPLRAVDPGDHCAGEKTRGREISVAPWSF
jgi:hypothetical protein